MKKRMTIMLVLVGVFVIAIALWKVKLIFAGIAQGKKFAPPPDTVTTVVARSQKWQPVLNAVGSLKAVNGVVVSTDLAGVVSRISFESGTPVKKGDLLVQLDTRQEESLLRSAEARRDLAKVNLERQNDLLAKKAASQSEYDTAAAEFRQAEAAVDDARALIARKTIVAPFDGLLGIRMLDLGQYLNVGTPMVPLQSLDPIYVNFSVPQQHLDQISVGGKLRLKAEGIAGAEFEGIISAIDSRVDEATRNISVRGTIPKCRPQAAPRHVRQCRAAAPGTGWRDRDSVLVDQLRALRGFRLRRAGEERPGRKTDEAVAAAICKTRAEPGRSGLDHLGLEGGRRGRQLRRVQAAQWRAGACEQHGAARQRAEPAPARHVA